jgi:hypothetical protein
MPGAILLLPQHVFTSWCLVKHRDDFTFTYLHFLCVILELGAFTTSYLETSGGSLVSEFYGMERPIGDVVL